MAPQERAVHIGWIDAVSDLELLRSRTTMPGRMGNLALRRRPGENLARTAQSAPNSRMNSPYDPAHGYPELPEASGSSHVAMHGVKGTAPNSVGEDDNHLHP